MVKNNLHERHGICILYAVDRPDSFEKVEGKYFDDCGSDQVRWIIATRSSDSQNEDSLQAGKDLAAANGCGFAFIDIDDKDTCKDLGQQLRDRLIEINKKSFDM